MCFWEQKPQKPKTQATRKEWKIWKWPIKMAKLPRRRIFWPGGGAKWAHQLFRRGSLLPQSTSHLAHNPRTYFYQTLANCVAPSLHFRNLPPQQFIWRPNQGFAAPLLSTLPEAQAKVWPTPPPRVRHQKLGKEPFVTWAFLKFNSFFIQFYLIWILIYPQPGIRPPPGLGTSRCLWSIPADRDASSFSRPPFSPASSTITCIDLDPQNAHQEHQGRPYFFDSEFSPQIQSFLGFRVFLKVFFTPCFSCGSNRFWMWIYFVKELA